MRKFIAKQNVVAADRFLATSASQMSDFCKSWGATVRRGPTTGWEATVWVGGREHAIAPGMWVVSYKAPDEPGYGCINSVLTHEQFVRTYEEVDW